MSLGNRHLGILLQVSRDILMNLLESTGLWMAFDKTEWTEYSLDELHEHVEVLPTEWNVTEMEGESDCQFLINKVDEKDVIIRHFAGGQQWRKEWFDK